MSIDDIIAVAGGTKSNIYRHFGGKEGLFLAAMQQHIGDVSRPLDQFPLNRLSLAEGLAVLGMAMSADMVTQDGMDFRRLVSAEAKRFPELGRQWFRLGPEGTLKVVAEFIEAQKRAGAVRADVEPLLAARLFTGMLTQRALLQTLYTPNDLSTAAEIEQLVAAAVEVFARSFGAARSSRLEEASHAHSSR